MNTQDSTLRRKRASTSFGSPLLSFRPKYVSRWGNIGEILKFSRDLKASQSFQFWLNKKNSELQNLPISSVKPKQMNWSVKPERTHTCYLCPLGNKCLGKTIRNTSENSLVKPNSFSSYNNWVLHTLRKIKVYHRVVTTPNTTVISLHNIFEKGTSLPNKAKD